MKVTIQITRECGERLLAAWRAEDAGYYATPHGYRAAGKNPAAGRCGFTPTPDGGRWVTCGCSCAWVHFDEAAGTARLVVKGPRRGIAALLGWSFPDPADLAAVRSAPATCKPTAPWPWWQTRDDAAPDGWAR